jgi:hypothetical protein
MIKIITAVIVCFLNLLLISEMRENEDKKDSACNISPDAEAGLSVFLDSLNGDSAVLILKNSHSCPIYLQGYGPQKYVVKGKGIVTDFSPKLIDKAIVTIYYDLLTPEKPHQYLSVWKHGHTFDIYELDAGRSLRFVVPSEYLSNKRQIAIRFNYSWERTKQAGMIHYKLTPVEILDYK